MATAVSRGTPTTPTNAYGNLSDPAIWMKLAGDKTALQGWFQSLSPKAPADLAAYYAQQAFDKPGANLTEQQGSAKYWSDRFTGDPKSLSGATVLGGAPSSTATPTTTPGGTKAGAGGLTIPTGAGGPHSSNPGGAPTTGSAIFRPGTTAANQADQANAYQAAILAALRQRQKAQGGGRASTILGGFGSSAPATAPATLLGA